MKRMRKFGATPVTVLTILRTFRFPAKMAFYLALNNFSRIAQIIPLSLIAE